MSGDQVTITQIGEPLAYVRLYDASSFAITAVNQGTKTFYIAENVPTTFLDNSFFTISGSTGNDGTYNVNGNATWSGAATLIVVDEVIPHAGPPAYGAISPIFVNLDTESASVAGTSIPLIAHTSDALYIGNTATFAYIGFLPNTAGAYGAVKVEYWNGAWIDITTSVKIDSTIGFSQRGYIAFPISGDWALYTVGGLLPSAYWVRLTVASVTTVATMVHMMRSLIIDKVLQFPSNLGDIGMRYTRDINGGIGQRDRGYKGVRSASIDMTPVSLIASELNLLLDWEKYGQEIYIEDSRQSSPISFTTDSYYKTYTGRLAKMPDGLKSMEKMVDTDYRIEFLIDAYTSLSTTLGLSA